MASRTVASLAAVACLVVVSCGSDAPAGAPGDGAGDVTSSGSATVASDAIVADRCMVYLHGKGGDGAAPDVAGGVATLSPRGNADGWGGRQWLYFPQDRFDDARSIVSDAVDGAGCSRVAIHGFSNGAAFAAALYCSGEDLDGRLVGVVVDDPVTDASAEGCSGSPGVEVALYWTTALADQAPVGAQCDAIDWTCDGGVIVGIDAYAGALGVVAQPSPFTDHQPYLDAPELARWLG